MTLRAWESLCLKHYYLMVIDKQLRDILEEVALSILNQRLVHNMTLILALDEVTMLEDTVTVF